MKQIYFLSLLAFFFNNISAQDSLSLKFNDSISLSIKEVKDKMASLGAVTEIKADDFNKGAIFSPMQLIQGKVPGFAIMRTLGNDPNQDLQIQLRGASSLFLSKEPLYLINGVVVEDPYIIMPEDIESIKVLKSISEIAPYGIRGSNGVVLIKSKNGESGKKLAASYSSYGYIEYISRKSDFLTAQEWRQIKQDWEGKAGAPSIWAPDYSVITSNLIDFGASTDWLKEITHTTFSHVHNLSFSGNINKTKYHAAMNYRDMNAVIKKSGNETYNGLITGSTFLLKNKLKIDVSVYGTRTILSQYNTNPFISYSNSNIVSKAEYYNPTIPVDYKYKSQDSSYKHLYLFNNPVFKLNNSTDKRERDNFFGCVQATYEILEGLTINALYSQNRLNEKYSFTQLSQRDTVNFDKYFSQITNSRIEKTFSAALCYNKNLKSHQIDISFNFSNSRNYEEYEKRDSSFSVYHVNYGGLYSGLDLRYTSFSIHFGYNYLKKYYFNTNLSFETTNTYMLPEHPNKNLFYPSISAVWLISNEDFLKNSSLISNLKLRAGYGKSYRGLTTFFKSYEYAFVAFPILNTSIPDPGLHGERVTEFDLGIDLGILSKIMISLDCFNRYTFDGIIEWSVSVPNSISPGYISNDTKIRNKGWELNINAQPVESASFKWMLNFNFSKTNSSLLSSFNLQKPEEGDAIGSFYECKFVGFTVDGKILNYDENGNIVENTWYRQVVGNALPKSYIGLTNHLVYHNFDMDFSLRGAMGFSIHNLNRFGNINVSSKSNIDCNFTKEIRTIDPRAISNVNLYHSDYFLEKGDFFKVDNISLGYNFKPGHRYIPTARFYIACNNVLTFTRFSGWDPEMAGITGTSPGVYSYNSYPKTCIFVLGLKLTI
jgi:TonB-linked SusC/RagA family outer membrane protein